MADFATVAELETFMGNPSGTLGARGTAMLTHASAAIRLHCQQDLEQTAGRQEEFAGDDHAVLLFLSQRPVTAVSAITVAAVAFAEYEWSRWGTIERNDEGAWDEGPILVTYDSGYAAASDEMAGIKTVCLEVAARALAGPVTDTFGPEIPELRGATPNLFLTEEEKNLLASYAPVLVG